MKTGQLLFHGGGSDPKIMKRHIRDFTKDKVRVAVLSIGLSNTILTEIREVWEKSTPRHSILQFITLQTGRLEPLAREFLDTADAIWINGGDTRRYHKILCSQPFRQIITQCRVNGGSIGGSSAGALIAPTRCIVWGGKSTSKGNYALNCPYANSEFRNNNSPLRLGTGLRLLDKVLLEVHATEFGRIPRLMEAMTKSRIHIGFAIDEDTFLSFNRVNAFRVSGKGRVFVVRKHQDGFFVRAFTAHQSFRSLPEIR